VRQRIHLLEAAVLDGEILNLLESTFASALFGGARAAEQSAAPSPPSFFSTSSSSSSSSSRRALLGAVLRGVVTSATVLANRPTPGQALQNLRYRDERQFRDPRTAGLLRLPGDAPTVSQRVAWIALSVVLPYAWPRARHEAVVWAGRRLREWLQAGGGGGGAAGAEEGARKDAHKDAAGVEVPPATRAALTPVSAAGVQAALGWCVRAFVGASAPEVAVGRALDIVEAMWGLASLSNLVVFMRRGVYATLINRLLRMRQVPVRAAASRALNFDYQNRQLVFSELNDFAMYVLPMLRVYSTLRATRRYAARGKARLQRLGRHMGWMEDGSASGRAATAAMVEEEVVGEEEGEEEVGDGDGVERYRASREVGVAAIPDVVDACAWCDMAPAQTPYVVSCGCTLCYYCLRTHVDPVLVGKQRQVEGEEGVCCTAVEASCPSCGQRMRWSRRWEDFYRHHCA
jgi:hypothetical protein